MAIAVKELVKLVENFGYKVSYPETKGMKRKKASLVDELLGAFEGAVPEDKTSTEYLKELRATGYGKY